MCVCVCVHICIYVCVYMNIYIFIQCIYTSALDNKTIKLTCSPMLTSLFCFNWEVNTQDEVKLEENKAAS